MKTEEKLQKLMKVGEEFNEKTYQLLKSKLTKANLSEVKDETI